MKTNNHSIDDLMQKYRSTHLRYFSERNISFLELLRPMKQLHAGRSPTTMLPVIISKRFPFLEQEHQYQKQIDAEADTTDQLLENDLSMFWNTLKDHGSWKNLAKVKYAKAVSTTQF